MIKDNFFKKAAFMKNKTLFLSLMVILVAVGVWIALAADELTDVTINHPSNNENISGNYTFSAATTGNADNVTFYYCNATSCYSICVNDTTGTAFNCTFNTTSISDGTYDINATAINSTGAEINATAITSVTFDNTNPLVTNFAVNDSDYNVTNTTSLNFSVTVSDPTANVSTVTINGTSLSQIASTEVWYTENATANFSCGADGNCIFLITATDFAGNINSTEIITLKVDNAAPTLSNITSPANNTWIADTIAINGSDVIDDTLDIAVYVNNTINVSTVADNVTEAGTHVTLTGLLDNATYLLILEVTDDSGNKKNSSEFVLKCDAVAPTVTASSSEGTSTTATTTIISGTAIDNGSGISHVAVNGVNATLTAATGVYTITVDLPITSENYFSVIAYDNVSHSSATISLIVTRTAAVTAATSGGGGTVSSTSITEQGTSIILRKGYIKTFILDKAYHTIKGVEIGTDYAILRVTSTPVTLTLKLLESKSFDFDNDGYYDLYIKLDEIKNSKAYLTLKHIHESTTAEAEEEEEPEEVPEEEPEEVPEEPPEEEVLPEEEEIPPAKPKTAMIIVLIIALLALIGFLIYEKKKRH